MSTKLVRLPADAIPVATVIQIGSVGVTTNVATARRFARLVPCENCSLPGCQYRRVPYKHSVPQIEDVRRLHGGANGKVADEPANASALTHDAK